MGVTQSQPVTSTDKFKLLITYSVAFIDSIVQPRSDLVFTVAPSTLTKTQFLPNKNMGLHTVSELPKDTLFTLDYEQEGTKMNDPMIDLTAVIQSSNSDQLYIALSDMYNNYYDLERVKQMVNVRIVMDSSKTSCYQAIKDIPAGGELLRIYGFATWLFEIFDLLTAANLAGYAKFLLEFQQKEPNDSFARRVAVTLDVLRKSNLRNYMVDDIIDMSKYELDYGSNKKHIGNMLLQKCGYVHNMVTVFAGLGVNLSEFGDAIPEWDY